MPGSSVNDCNALLNTKFAAAAYTSPTSVQIALTTTAPDPTGNGSIVEPTTAQYSGYARVTVACNSTNFPAAIGGQITNGVVITFPTSGGGISSPVTVTHAVALDISSGRVVGIAALPPSTTIANGDTKSFGIGGLAFSAA